MMSLSFIVLFFSKLTFLYALYETHAHSYVEYEFIPTIGIIFLKT